MKRYWFEFNYGTEVIPPGTKLGCGITAYNIEDAISILSDRVFKGAGIPAFKRKIEDVDISTLDSGHVLPNMSSPSLRGVWFPLGYN